MGTLVKTGEATFFDVYPKNNNVFTLNELQEYVGGYIQTLKLSNGYTMVCNENGFNLNLPANKLATWIVERSYDGAKTQQFVGDVLFLEDFEIK
jgi:hypothetical protein